MIISGTKDWGNLRERERKKVQSPELAATNIISKAMVVRKE